MYQPGHRKNARIWTNLVPLLHVCSIAHCIQQTSEMKYADKLRVGFYPTSYSLGSDSSIKINSTILTLIGFIFFPTRGWLLKARLVLLWRADVTIWVSGMFVKSRNICAGTFYCHAMEQFRRFHQMMQLYCNANINRSSKWCNYGVMLYKYKLEECSWMSGKCI